MGNDDVIDRAKRARSHGRGMTRGAMLTLLAVAAFKLGRRDGRWIWQRRAQKG
jgi:hypothetical protein